MHRRQFFTFGFVIAFLLIAIFIVHGLLSGNSTACATNNSEVHYCLEPTTLNTSYIANTPSIFSFSLTDTHGTTIKNFSLTHTKPLHLIIVRKDLQYFQHLHPEYDATTGIFTLKDLTFPVTGEYRAYADFAPKLNSNNTGETPVALATYDLKVGTSYVPEPLGSLDQTKTFDGNRITLATEKPLVSGKETTLSFVWERNGKPVTDLQEYLGALGHSVIIREGTLEYLHTHPLEDPSTKQTGTVHFMVNFPQSGNYKIFTQFKREQKIITSDFVVTVTRNTTTPTESMPEMHHGHGH